MGTSFEKGSTIEWLGYSSIELGPGFRVSRPWRWGRWKKSRILLMSNFLINVFIQIRKQELTNNDEFKYMSFEE